MVEVSSIFYAERIYFYKQIREVGKVWLDGSDVPKLVVILVGIIALCIYWLMHSDHA